MVHIPTKNLKTLAIGLRKKGFSYSEIRSAAKIPKSTLSLWLKNIKLSESEEQRLEQKRFEARKRGSKTRMEKISEAIEKIKNNSAKDIGKISKRELWLVGIVMYWKNKNRNDPRRGVSFSSSDPSQIKLFLKWLQEIGGIKDQEIMLDVFIGKNEKDSINEGISYWSKITRFPADWFTRVYYLNNNLNNKNNKKTSKKSQSGFSQSGFLRIRVRASSMLARQISGWIEGVRKCL